MRADSLLMLLVAIGSGAPAAARVTGAPATTLTTGGPQSRPTHPDAADGRRLEEAILAITPRPRLSIDCGPAQQQAAQSDLERAQYQLKCGR